jgi:hydrogenase-4 component E
MKGLVIPALLRRAMRTANIDRDLFPLIGFLPSLLLGAAGTIGAVVLARRLPLLPEHHEIAAGGGGAGLGVHRVAAVDRPVQGHLPGLRLPGARERHLSFRHAAARVHAAAGGGRHPAGPDGGVFVIGIIVDRIQRAFDTLDTRKLTVLRE